MIEIKLSFYEAADAVSVLAEYNRVTKEREEKELAEDVARETAAVIRNEPAPGVYSESQAAEQNAKELAKLSAVKAEAPKEEKPSSPPPAESAAPGVTYDDLKASIMKLVAKNPAEMKKVCEAFGLKTFAGTTDPVLWAKAKEMIDAKVAA